MDQPTDGKMDTPSFRDAWTHLKTTPLVLVQTPTFRWREDEPYGIEHEPNWYDTYHSISKEDSGWCGQWPHITEANEKQK